MSGTSKKNATVNSNQNRTKLKNQKPLSPPKKKKMVAAKKNAPAKKNALTKKTVTGAKKKQERKKGKSKVTKKKKAKKTRKRVPHPRNIIRSVKTPWIQFCSEKRPDVVAANPELDFGDVCKFLSPEWKSLSDDMRKKYVDMHEQDKKRYADDFAKLTPEQQKTLRAYRRQKRSERRLKPRPPLSAYMFYVKETREQTKLAHPDADFKTIGQLLGESWNGLSADDKQKFYDQSNLDKQRHAAEMVCLERLRTQDGLEAYKVYADTTRPELQKLRQGAGDDEINKVIASKWRDMSFEQKSKFLVA